MRKTGVCLAAVALAVGAQAQHDHAQGAPSAQAAHHAYIELERQALERGEGFGMAMVADRHGFPGPKHILDLHGELALTAEQEEQVKQRFAEMKAKAIALGERIREQEAELETVFAAGAPEAATVRSLLEKSARLRAALRWVHLSAHLDAKSFLTAEQQARYHALRYGARQHPH